MFAPSSIPYTVSIRERQTSRVSLLRTATALLFRRQELDQEADAALLSGRVLAMQPMSWVDGHRPQRRDGRGRFLPRTWLADAELFLPSDRAFFRRPIPTEYK